MKDYIVKITYSSGQEEESIALQAYSSMEAFTKMLEIANTEVREIVRVIPYAPVHLYVKPEAKGIVLWYGYDGTEAYYMLREAR